MCYVNYLPIQAFIKETFFMKPGILDTLCTTILHLVIAKRTLMVPQKKMD